MRSSPAPNSRRRPRVAALAALGALAVVAGAGFYVLFANQQGLGQMLSQKTDELAAVYLEILLEMNPGDVDLRLGLVRHLADLGRAVEASAKLEPLLAVGNSEVPVRLLALELAWKSFHATPAAATDRRNALLTVAKSHLEQLTRGSLTQTEAGHAADLAWQTGRPDLAAVFYRKMADVSTDGAETEALGCRAIEAMRAADRGEAALELAQHFLRRFPNAADLLRASLAAARAQNQGETARAWGRRLLALFPEDPALLEQQIDLELAAADVAAADGLTGRWLALRPDCAACRVRAARLAEWNGRADAALEQWAWLALERGDAAAATEAKRLAEGLYGDALWLRLAERELSTRPLDPQALGGFEQRYGRSGDGADWIEFLRHAAQRQPDAFFLAEALARAHRQAGDGDAALAVLAPWGGRAVSGAVAARVRAEILWDRGDAIQALDTLRTAAVFAGADDQVFWRLYGELAWNLERGADALAAFQRLVESGAAAPYDRERLIHLLRETGHYPAAVEFARRDFETARNPRFLLMAMSAALEGRDWSSLERLVDAADRDPEVFHTRADFWLTRAVLYRETGRSEEAQRMYWRATQIQPDSREARLGMLWLRIDQRLTDGMLADLRAWEGIARNDPDFWAAFGAAYVTLGDDRAALPWFRLHQSQGGDNPLWLLSYAGVLQRNGREREAYRVRRRALRALAGSRPAGRLADAGTAVARAGLVRDMAGVPAGFRALRAAWSGHEDRTGLIGVALADALTAQNLEAARHWLPRAQVDHRQLPAGQRLEVALATNDRDAVTTLLAEEGDRLSASVRSDALERIGQRRDALRLLEEQSETGVYQAELLGVRRRSLLRETVPFAAGGWEFKTLGTLDLERLFALGSFAAADGQRLAGQFSHVRLDTTGDGLLNPLAVDEYDFTLRWDGRLADNGLLLKGGVNLRDQGANIFYGNAGWQHPLDSWGRVGLIADVNEPTEDSAALRAIGTKSQLAVQLVLEPTRREYARLRFGGHQYRTRDGGHIGTGYSIDGEIGTHLLLGEPWLQLRLQGNLQANSLTDEVPDSLLHDGLIAAGRSTREIIAPEFRMFGAGFRIGTGETDGLPGRMYATLDGWLGGIWPQSEFAYRFSGRIGGSLFGRDLLAAEAFYASVQGGQTGQSYQGVQVSYQVWF